MDLAHIRLEVLRLAHRHDQSAETVVERAEKLERYVTKGRKGTKEKSKESATGDPQQAR